MKTLDFYTVVVTRELDKCVEFYRDVFGFEIGFSSSWFVWMYRENEGGGKCSVAFMSEDHPSSPPGPEVFGGEGAFFTLHVESVDIVVETLRAKGIEIAYGPKNEDWGQRRIMVDGPGGMKLDVVEMIEPKAGFWDEYLTG